MAICSSFRHKLFHRILIGDNVNYQPGYNIVWYGRAITLSVVNSRSPRWNRLLGAFLSTGAVPSVSTSIKSINIAVCVERLPLITPAKSNLEERYEELQQRLEYEHSSLSDYELSKAEIMNKREQLKQDEDNEELRKEVAQLDSQYQELKELEQEHTRDVTFGGRTSEADLINDQTSPIRKLELPLFLLTPDQEGPKKWRMPQGNVKPGETLREAAERIVKEQVDDDIELRFMSNAPSGAYRRAEKDGANPDSPKVFFYQAQLLGAIHKYRKEIWSNCIWASKDELAQYLPSNYYQSVLRFLF